MILKRLRYGFLMIFLLGGAAMACSLDTIGDGIPNNAVIINVNANTSLLPWLDTAVAEFNETNTETAGGDPIFVAVSYTEAGTAVNDLRDTNEIALWIPDNKVWANVLADQGNDNYQDDCISIAESPLVIAMWRPIAETLGWPGLPIGWLDIGSLAADPSAWNYYSGGELGDNFRMGHTHPGLSGSGTSTLLAIVQAAELKETAVLVADIEKPIVQASVGAFEGGVTWFSTSTQSLGVTMSERGLDYLAAGIMYESTVLQYGQERIVPIYPLEGTFMATHPACINAAAAAEVQDGAEAFREYLRGAEGQEVAMLNGLRPVNESVAISGPFTAQNGVDINQPAIRFAPPSVETVYAIQELWQEARKDVNLVMLLDTSGSMRGRKMSGMQEAAVQFVEQMGDDDFITLIAFHTQPDLLVNHAQVGPNRGKIITAIEDLRAAGDTTLFDAIGDGSALLTASTSPETANALVVLTDGQDTASYRFNRLTALEEATVNNATVFTIAYGGDADDALLLSLAEQANGNFFQGDEASIAAIYEEMSAAFGGAVGVGR